MLVALAGGWGRRACLAGLVQVVDPASITAVVNTGDDTVLHGLYISPDIDTVTYTLAGAQQHGDRLGPHRRDLAAMEALERSAARTGSAWATATWPPTCSGPQRLRDGASLEQVTAELAARPGGRPSVCCPCPTSRYAPRLTLAGTTASGRARSASRTTSCAAVTRSPFGAIRFEGADRRRPAPVCSTPSPRPTPSWSARPTPSCPSVRFLAVPGIAEALAARRDDVVAVSPIVAGRRLKGPADRLLTELGHESSVVGVARLYAGWAGPS